MEGFTPLGHVQTGNIFVEGRLGGYENTLMGYRSKLYRKIVQNNEYSSIDVIMFGEWVWCVLSCDLMVLLPPRSCDLRDECWSGVSPPCA